MDGREGMRVDLCTGMGIKLVYRRQWEKEVLIGFKTNTV